MPSTKNYQHDGQGNTISSTLVGGSRGMDVNVLNTITAELDAGSGVGISTITATAPLGVSLTTKDVILSGTVSAFITNTGATAIPFNLSTFTAGVPVTISLGASTTVSAVQSGAWSVTVGIAAGSNTVSAILATSTVQAPLPVSLSSAVPAGANTIGAVLISGTTTSRIPTSPDTATTIIVATTTNAPPFNLSTFTAGVPLAVSLTAKDIILTSGSATIGAVLVSGTTTASVPGNLATVTAASPLGVSLTTKDVVLSGTASVVGTVALTGGAAQAGAWSVSSVQQGTWSIAALPVIGVVYDSSMTSRAVQFTFTSLATNGIATLVAAQGASLTVQVLSYTIVVNTGVTANLIDAATTAAKKAGGAFAANGGIACGWNPGGWFKSQTNQALAIQFSASGGADVAITFIAAP